MGKSTMSPNWSRFSPLLLVRQISTYCVLGSLLLASFYGQAALAQASTVVDDFVGTTEGVFVDIDPLANDTGTFVSGSLGQLPANGNVLIVGPLARYTPNAGFVGIDSFTYLLTDINGIDFVGTVTVTVYATPVGSE